MCSFYVIRNGALLITIIHVEDTRGFATHAWLKDEFIIALRIEFDEEPDASERLDHFTANLAACPPRRAPPPPPRHAFGMPAGR